MRGTHICAALAAIWVGCGGAGETPTDGAVDATAGLCTSDTSCDDGAYCNGAERCMPGATGADVHGCVLAAALPCDATMACDEAMHACTAHACAGPDGDLDADGHRSMVCGGDDCDDDDANAYPGNTEVCDTSDHDEDCDPGTYGFRDADMDGSADGRCCNLLADGSLGCGPDCDDMAPGVHPAEVESCNGEDDDCDGMIDEGAGHTYHADADGDGFGDPAGATMEGCFAPPGFADDATDCDDTRAAVHPGALEQCDAPDGGRPLDEDCDGMTNPPGACDCAGSASRSCMALGRCAAGTQSCVTGHWSACSITPSPEVCNGEDDDCNGVVDEGVRVDCYADGDADGYARVFAAHTTVCGACGAGTTNRAPTTGNIDCDDTRMQSHPGATEICDRHDNNCDGTSSTAEDADNDMHTGVAFAGCTGGFPKDDCHDNNVNVHPGATTFHTTTYCTSGSTACAACGGSCIGAGGACGMVCIGSVPGSWDYNCDGTPTRQPSGDTCHSGGSCVVVGGCGTPGYSYAGSPACGTSETYHPCTCSGSSCSDTTMLRPLACR